MELLSLEIRVSLQFRKRRRNRH